MYQVLYTCAGVCLYIYIYKYVICVFKKKNVCIYVYTCIILILIVITNSYYFISWIGRSIMSKSTKLQQHFAGPHTATPTLGPFFIPGARSESCADCCSCVVRSFTAACCSVSLKIESFIESSLQHGDVSKTVQIRVGLKKKSTVHP